MKEKDQQEMRQMWKIPKIEISPSNLINLNTKINSTYQNQINLALLKSHLGKIDEHIRHFMKFIGERRRLTRTERDDNN